MVDKPFMLSSEQRDPRGESVLTLLQEEYPSAQLPHRLDRVTCGVLVVATDREALALHNAAIASGDWGPKIYVARLKSSETVEPGPRKAFLRRKARKAEVVRSGGKPSFLEVLFSSRVSRDCVDVVIRLQTGRYHQIRAMMANEGMPVLHDTLYGGGEPSERPSLCHAALRLPNRILTREEDEERLVVESSFVRDFFSEEASGFLKSYIASETFLLNQ